MILHAGFGMFLSPMCKSTTPANNLNLFRTKISQLIMPIAPASLLHSQVSAGMCHQNTR